MYKKLLVFSLAFCLGVILWQTAIPLAPNEISSVNGIVTETSNTAEINSYQPDASNFSETIFAQNLEKDNGRFGIAGVNDDKEVKDLYLEFQKAVATDDKKVVASMMYYPLRVYFPTDCLKKSYRLIKTEKAFLKVYDKIFDEKLKELIAQINVESNKDIWARYEGISVGRGDIWIGVYCYQRRCEDKKYFIKIRTIHGNNFRC
jgi:hypothetical protein